METQYYSHLCLCGCGGQIKIRKSHKYDGMPQYINGHNETNGNKIHGGYGTILHHIWLGIKCRCNNPKHKSYKDYGGRGITICPEWTNDYTKFRDWALSNNYAEGLQINRIENDANYEPNNCNWVTSAENCQNRKTTKLNTAKVKEIRIKYNSGYYSQNKLAKEYDISQTTVFQIVNFKTWKI